MQQSTKGPRQRHQPPEHPGLGRSCFSNCDTRLRILPVRFAFSISKVYVFCDPGPVTAVTRPRNGEISQMEIVSGLL